MRKTFFFIAALVTLGLAASDLQAHGGSYTGPSGGATPGFSGAVGGGTGQPGPGNPNPGGGGATPGNSGGTSPGQPGGGSPVRPGGGAPPGGRGGTGRTTPGGAAKPKGASQPFLNWDFWWDLNEERFLNLKSVVRSQAAASDNSDTILGGVMGGDDVAEVTARQIRNEILPTLKQALKDSYYDTRAAAVIALGKVADSSDVDAMEAIKALLKDSDNRVRESSCLGLGILGSKEAIPHLLDVAKNTKAGRKLVGRDTGDVLTRTRAFATVALGLIGSREDLSDDVMKELLTLTTTKGANKDLQVGAAVALQLMNRQDVVPQLIEIFSDAEQDKYARSHVGIALGKMDAKAAIPTFRNFLGDKSNYVAYASAIGLGMLADSSDKDTIKALQRTATNGRDVGTRNFSLMALAEIGGGAARSTLLDNARKGKTVHQKTFGALGAGVTGYLHKEEVNLMGQTLLDLFKKEKAPAVRSAQAVALGLLSYEPAREVIRKAIGNTSDPMLQGHLCTALGLLDDQDAIPTIQKLVSQRGDPDLRKNAAIALGLLRDRGAVDVLKKVISESQKSKAILGAATVAMGYIGDRSAVPVLVDFVENPKQVHQDVTRAFATVALGFLGDKDALPILSKIHENSSYLAQTGALAELLSIL